MEVLRVNPGEPDRFLLPAPQARARERIKSRQACSCGADVSG